MLQGSVFSFLSVAGEHSVGRHHRLFNQVCYHRMLRLFPELASYERKSCGQPHTAFCVDMSSRLQDKCPRVQLLRCVISTWEYFLFKGPLNSFQSNCMFLYSQYRISHGLILAV